MPRPHKKDILHHRWEYTLLGDDFSALDKTAQNLSPEAGTLVWRGYSYPDVAYEAIEKITSERGPWWLPDDEIWLSNDLILSILRKAFTMGSVPVIKDTLLDNNDSIEIIQQATVYIPQISLDSEYQGDKIKLRTVMRNLIVSDIDEKTELFSKLVKMLDEFPRQKNAFKVKLCLIAFPHRIWLEGIYHKRIHPVIVIPTNVFERYHTETE